MNFGVISNKTKDPDGKLLDFICTKITANNDITHPVENRIAGGRCIGNFATLPSLQIFKNRGRQHFLKPKLADYCPGIAKTGRIRHRGSRGNSW